MKGKARSDLITCPGSANLSHPWEQNNPQLNRAQVNRSRRCWEHQIPTEVKRASVEQHRETLSATQGREQFWDKFLMWFFWCLWLKQVSVLLAAGCCSCRAQLKEQGSICATILWNQHAEHTVGQILEKTINLNKTGKEILPLMLRLQSKRLWQSLPWVSIKKLPGDCIVLFREK